jgi:CMP-N-acetylneuraminic acid synthetase
VEEARHLAIVPARGGSVGLKDKNLRRIGGKSLVAHAVTVALGVPEIKTVLVSTESAAIADEARRYGALVPFIRPQELAQSGTPMVEVLAHACGWYRTQFGMPEEMAVVLLQPTSPMRRLEHIRAAIALYERARSSGERIAAVQTVSPIPDRYRPESLCRLDDANDLKENGLSPEEECLVYRNGAAIVIDPDRLDALTLRQGLTLGLFIQEPLISIDTWEDLAEAERAMAGHDALQ